MLKAFINQLFESEYVLEAADKYIFRPQRTFLKLLGHTVKKATITLLLLLFLIISKYLLSLVKGLLQIYLLLWLQNTFL